MYTQHLVVLVTCPTRVSARRIAQGLVQKRLAACVNIVPAIESLFFWEGRVDHAKEILLVIKTARHRFEALRKTILSLHPYQVPEIIALPIVVGHPPYLQWVRQSLNVR